MGLNRLRGPLAGSYEFVVLLLVTEEVLVSIQEVL